LAEEDAWFGIAREITFCSGGGTRRGVSWIEAVVARGGRREWGRAARQADVY